MDRMKVRSKWNGRCLGLTLALGFFACHDSSARPRAYRITLSKPSWSRFDERSGARSAFLEPRLLARRDAATGELLLRAMERSAGEPQSLEIVAVTLNPSTRTREASVGEWDRALPLATNAVDLTLANRRDPTAIVVAGHAYPTESPPTATAIASVQSKWLAVVTEEVKQRSGGFFTFLGGGDPKEGSLKVSLYETRSHLKVLAEAVRFSPSERKFKRPGDALWIEDRCFILVLNSPANDLLIVATDGSR